MRAAGIDQGTTGTKGVVLDGDSVIDLPRLAHRQFFPHPGYVEHDPRELLDSVRTLVEAAAGQGATALGVANQGETVVIWNRDTGEPLAPAIVWQDQRTNDSVERLRADGCAGEITERSGLPLDSYFSASKLRWLLDNIDGAAALARRGRLGLGTSDSYFLDRLCGRYATDPTTASRTSLMNAATLEWDERLCALFGVPVELLPEITGDAVGTTHAAAGEIALTAAAVDQIAALYGHGCRAPGDGKVTVGTGAFALILRDPSDAAPLPGSVPTVGWRSGQRHVRAADGGVYSAAAALDWLERIGLSTRDEVSTLHGPSAASRGLMFVPALAGLAFPHWDRSASGLFIGIDAATERADLIKAVLEGVAFRIAEVLDGLGFGGGGVVPVDGGLARSVYFTQFLADISGRFLAVRPDAEVTAIGMAQLAAAGAAGVDPGTAPPVPLGETRTVAPSAPAGDLRDRFTDAVRRSCGWRR
jgi:glycerol kinase